MALLFAIIGALIIGGVSNSTAGLLSFVVIWILVGAYEEMEIKVGALQRKINELESELSIARNTRPERREKELYEWNVL
ncbi:MAG: hypothetical protein ACYC48_00030 [Minisyncoccota bacterium]